jgi:uncharacterized protein (TIGR00288 family)
MLTIYVDGENHFQRAEACWQKMHAGTNLATAQANINTNFQFPWGQPRLRVEKRSLFFWDSQLVQFLVRDWEELLNDVVRAVYFTSASGDEIELHDVRCSIRKHGFEPYVVKKEAKQRQPKAVDVALAVRMMEDAHRNAFERCLLCTSDTDFLPVIQAVKRMGKLVYVLGYADSIGDRSPLQYDPDLFIDLESIMRRDYTPT